jgi:NAD-dependent protein deacetylase/lipoamidase
MSKQEMIEKSETVSLLANWINEAESVVAFTGAGISTESGIPDFRSPGGIWTKYDPRELTFQKFLADPEVRKLRWKMFMENESMWKAKPNNAHKAIADLNDLGKLDGLITQNIDGLHQAGGVPPEKVIEIHGTNREVSCLDCGARWPSEEIRDRIKNENLEIPDCAECGGIIKTATISFGQSMPEKEVMESEQLSKNADLMLAIGSSLVVHPAALMPVLTKQSGGKVVIINLSETGGDDYADMLIHEKAGEFLPKVIECYKENHLT